MDFVLGIFTGLALAGAVCVWRFVLGVLVVNRSNPNKDVYRFEIDDLDELTKKRFVLLKIVDETGISHE